MEELQTRHRKEQKELQSRITQKKKNATKKTRKGVNDECDRLEREMKERQQDELGALDPSHPAHASEDLEVDDAQPLSGENVVEPPQKKVSFTGSTQHEKPTSAIGGQQTKTPNRQKARLARRAAEREAQSAAAAEEASNQPDLREQEMTAMKQHKDKLGLNESFIRPDGHCLFSACAHGLPEDVVKQSGPFTEPYQNVRYATAEFMSQHRDDFEAFLEEPFDSYVKKIKDTAEWGGQLELQAIAKSYNVTINVLQADGRVEKFPPSGSDSGVQSVWLAYYRHSFGLGEHYNSLSLKQ